jgi:palmitoyltransferase
MRTRRYRIVSKVTGSWFPLLSYGFKVCIHPPFTDEPRIKLEPDDLVNVTRWRKHWLFGEKVQEPAVEQNGKTKEDKLEIKPKRVRGWFPRKAAIEFFEDNDDSDDDYEDNEVEKKKN